MPASRVSSANDIQEASVVFVNIDAKCVVAVDTWAIDIIHEHGHKQDIIITWNMRMGRLTAG
jgi:hypothetical protein